MKDVKNGASLPDWVRKHIEIYLRDGEAGHMWEAPDKSGVYSTLLLTTTGRKSGKKLMLPLIYRPTDEGNYCIIASKGGAPVHPAWFLNLKANPHAVEAKVRNVIHKVYPRVVEGKEREKLWNMMAAYFPNYHDYKDLAEERQIPVVVLERS
jgi:deazaflavin-dependent oxidoreductase (nitroreductase family)